ncbi:hypothetical protein ACWATR_37110 [Nostoc sp. UIC 10890]
MADEKSLTLIEENEFLKRKVEAYRDDLSTIQIKLELIDSIMEEICSREVINLLKIQAEINILRNLLFTVNPHINQENQSGK